MTNKFNEGDRVYIKIGATFAGDLSQVDSAIQGKFGQVTVATPDRDGDLLVKADGREYSNYVAETDLFYAPTPGSIVKVTGPKSHRFPTGIGTVSFEVDSYGDVRVSPEGRGRYSWYYVKHTDLEVVLEDAEPEPTETFEVGDIVKVAYPAETSRGTGVFFNQETTGIVAGGVPYSDEDARVEAQNNRGEVIRQTVAVKYLTKVDIKETIKVGDKIEVTDPQSYEDGATRATTYVDVVTVVTPTAIETEHFYFSRHNPGYVFKILEAAPDKPVLPTEVGAIVIGTVRGQEGVTAFREGSDDWRSLTTAGGRIFHRDEHITDWVVAEVKPKV